MLCPVTPRAKANCCCDNMKHHIWYQAGSKPRKEQKARAAHLEEKLFFLELKCIVVCHYRELK
jgi:hypothetical protein